MKKITAILIALDVILLGVSIAVFVGEDRTPPVIRMEETELEYREGMSDEALLEGVSAMDETDGDVTASLVIEKVSETGTGTVIVTYGARDAANNVAKASRVMRSRVGK